MMQGFFYRLLIVYLVKTMLSTLELYLKTLGKLNLMLQVFFDFKKTLNYLVSRFLAR